MRKPSSHTTIRRAESSGALLQVFFLSIQISEFQPVLDKYGIHAFEADQWYPMGLILDIFEEIQNSPNAMQNLVSIGMKVTETIDFRSRFATLEDLLEAMPQMEHEMHRGNPSVWEVHRIDAHTMEVIDRTVWPHDLEYGTLYGMAHLYQDQHSYFVERTDIAVDPKTGDETAVYVISWE
jgi:hypothetical protein